MINIKLFNKLAACGIDKFDKSKYLVSEDAENYRGIIVRSAKLHDIDFSSELICIARAGSGTNNIPINKCTQNGIVVFNTPGANANAVKELVLCSLLMSSRKIPSGIMYANSLKGLGGDVPSTVEKEKSRFSGPEIEGKTLGIIGLGAVGVLVANAAINLGMKVYGYDPYMAMSAAWMLNKSTIKANNLNDIYSNCDYITIHTPMTEETKGFINSQSIAKMKDNVRILNFARGELVNNADVIAAIGSQKISCYVTDFPCEEILGIDGIIAMPHIGASTPESENNCAEMASNQMIDYIENGNITNSVNFPSISMPRETKIRLCVINKNVPNMLGTISTLLASLGINIENMANRSKDDYAYTIIETNSDISQDTINKIKNTDNVVSVRIIRDTL